MENHSLLVLLGFRGFTKLDSLPPSSPSAPPSGLAFLHVRFVYIFPYVVLGSTLLTSCSTPAWFCTSCCHFDGLFRLFCCVCHPFAPSLLISNTWSTCFCAELFYSCNLSIYGLFPNPGLHTCFGLNLTVVWTKTMFWRQSCLLHKVLFYTQTVLYTKAMFYTKTMFLLGLCKRCLWLAG